MKFVGQMTGAGIFLLFGIYTLPEWYGYVFTVWGCLGGLATGVSLIRRLRGNEEL